MTEWINAKDNPPPISNSKEYLVWYGFFPVLAKYRDVIYLKHDDKYNEIEPSWIWNNEVVIHPSHYSEITIPNDLPKTLFKTTSF